MNSGQTQLSRDNSRKTILNYKGLLGSSAQNWDSLVTGQKNSLRGKRKMHAISSYHTHTLNMLIITLIELYIEYHLFG